VLALIILSACALASVWVLRVPLLQNPDESSHIDYVFSVYSAGRLLNVRRPPSSWNVHPRFEGRKDREGPESFPYELLSHRYTLYLIDATEFQRIRFHPEEKVRSGHGTIGYYRKLDAAAPQQPPELPDLQPRDNPWMVTAYPFLYYAVVAVFLKVMSVFGSGPVWLFLCARFLSVAFLAGSLLLTYKVLRELHWRKERALLLTAVVAFFPLTTFVAASVQPDNLALLLVLLCWYLTLRLRRSDQSSSDLVLGVALGALLVTKYHIFVFTAFAVLATLITEAWFRRRSLSSIAQRLLLLVVPSVLLFTVQFWVVWGGERITGGNLHSARSGLVTGIKSALYDYYRGGPAWVSWWGTFGWGDATLVIWSDAVQAKVWRVLSVLTLLVLLLVFLRTVQIIFRLLLLAKRSRWRFALRLAFSNPLIISHLIFSAFMVLLYALTDNAFFAQGRHWFPLTVSGFVIATQFAPRVLPHRKLRTAFSTLLLIALLVYCAVGGYFSLKTITERYYPPSFAQSSRRPKVDHFARVAVKVPTVEWYL
jgi:hypothetical protein